MRVVRVLRLLIMIGLIVILSATVAGAAVYVAAPRLSAYDDVDSGELYSAVKHVAVHKIAEQPHLSPNPPDGEMPICAEVAENSRKPLALAFGLMRATDEGVRLYQMLLDEGVCITVDDIPFNAAYAESRRIFPDDWSDSRIVVDRSLARSSLSDLLAAILVHEATHIDRAVSGEACFFTDTCEELANGVELDEEVAAHRAEAEWWIAAFGIDGKRFAIYGDYGENKLAEAYLKGDDAFRIYVYDYRSDPREGAGIS